MVMFHHILVMAALCSDSEDNLCGNSDNVHYHLAEVIRNSTLTNADQKFSCPVFVLFTLKSESGFALEENCKSYCVLR